MKKIYEQPMTDVVSVELTQLMAGSPIESGGPLEKFPDTDEKSGNLSLDFTDLWN